MLQPNRVKCGWLSGVFNTCYYLTVLWGWSPGSSERARAPREPRRGQSLAISDILAPAQVLGPTSMRPRPWHVGAPGLSRPHPPRLRELLKRLRALGGTLVPASVPP